MSKSKEKKKKKKKNKKYHYDPESFFLDDVLKEVKERRNE